MRIFFQARIRVAGQHFAVCVDVDAAPLRLFQEQFKVAQIVSRNDYERPLFDFSRNARRYGVAVGGGVCAVKSRHTFEIYFARLHHERQKFGLRIRLCEGAESLVEKRVDGGVRNPQNFGVVRIGGSAF